MNFIAAFIFALFVAMSVSQVAGHAYFVTPLPRDYYCYDASNTACLVAGPIYGMPASTASNAITTTANAVSSTCNTAVGQITTLPGLTQATPNVKQVVPAGTPLPLVLFISQDHSTTTLNASYYTDGWTIRGRDIGNGAALFTTLPSLSWVDNSTRSAVMSNGLWDHHSFVIGNFLHLSTTTQAAASSDFAYQFYWGDSQIAGGVAWLSCADVKIGLSSGASMSSIVSLASSVFAVIGAFLLRKFTQ